MRHNTRTQAGFSLIELMIAVVIMGVVTAQLFVVMGNQKKVYSSNERAVATPETARMTLALISFDTRHHDSMVQPWDAVSSFDGGTTDPDRFCVSSAFADPGVEGDDNPMHGLIKRFPGAVVKVIGGNSVDVDVLDIDKDGNPDFLTGGGIIVASKRESYCGGSRRPSPMAPPSRSPSRTTTARAGSRAPRGPRRTSCGLFRRTSTS
jgi:prepilin-type N-terminal cleavage/methylation domain-containing protein